MAFWDGERWIRSQPSAPRERQNRVAAWIATGLMLLGLAAVFAPTGELQARTPSITVDRDEVLAGQVINLWGTAFTPKASVTVHWNDGLPIAETVTNGSGKFRVRIVVPTTSETGQQRITAIAPSTSESATASVKVEVIGREVAATPSAIATATVRASATPHTATPAPTVAEVAVATPTVTPAPATVLQATPVLVPAATPAASLDEALDVPAEYGTIQAAINAAAPGQTVRVAPGTYVEALQSVRSDVTVLGYGAVLRGNGVGRPSTAGGTYLLIHVTHSNVTFAGFELTNAWRGARIESASGSSLIDLKIHHVGRTGIEISHGAVGAAVRGAQIHTTGLAGEGNAEAIYIGTARSADSWTGPDLTRNGVITGSVLGPGIAEGIDIKDDVTGFTVSGNVVVGATEADSGAINVRGHHNRFEANVVRNNLGSGMRFGGTAQSPAVTNVLRNNTASNNGGYGYKFIDGPQDAAGNTGSGNAKGLVTFGGATFPI